MSLDDLHNTRYMEERLRASGRLDDMSIALRKPFLTALSEHLQERGSGASDDVRTRFQYVVTDTDIDTVAYQLTKDLEAWTNW